MTVTHPPPVSSPPPPGNPVLVEVRRGARVESRHRGCVVAVDAGGRQVFAAGRVSESIYPRSSLKFFQAIPLIAGGAAHRFNLSAAEIALACASHSAEAFHLRAVTGWLQRLGLSADDLECGAEPPLSERAARDLIRVGEPHTRAHHNCSGKHAGMLTVAGHIGAATRGYSDYHHPCQRAWMQALSEWLGTDVFSLPWERDGCGLPAICMPLDQLARAFAGCADAGRLAATSTSAPGAALARIIEAVRAQPRMLAGTGRCCTDVIRATAGRVLIKAGAEGVCGGVIPGLGLGFALKIDDGAGRARDVAVGALLHRLGALDASSQARLEMHFRPKVVNSQGRVTGEIAPAEWFAQGA